MCGPAGHGLTDRPIDESVVQLAQAACPVVLIWLILCVFGERALLRAMHSISVGALLTCCPL